MKHRKPDYQWEAIKYCADKGVHPCQHHAAFQDAVWTLERSAARGYAALDAYCRSVKAPVRTASWEAL
jgi:hypothetical protein